MTYRPENLEKYIYFLRRTNDIGPIKIGCSRLPPRRLTEFYRWSPYELKLLTSTAGGHNIEAQLHRMFAAYRSHMEWFAPSERLLNLIEAVRAGATIEAAIAAAAAIPHQPSKVEAA